MNKKQDISYTLAVELPLVLGGMAVPVGLYLLGCKLTGSEIENGWLGLLIFFGNVIGFLTLLLSNGIRGKIDKRIDEKKDSDIR